MSALSKYKSVLFLLAALAVAFFAYTYFFPSGEDSGEALTSEDLVASPIENELVQLLLRLESVTLPEAIFGNSSFQSLEDFSQQIPEEPRGRENPFAPFSGALSGNSEN